MSGELPILHILLVEDDRENLVLLQQSLPTEVDGYRIEWEPCDSFERAVQLVMLRRYDVVVTDIYRDRDDHEKGDPADEKAASIVDVIRNIRFCPIVMFTDGSAPQTITLGPFIKYADKSGGNEDILAKLSEILSTGIPSIARKLHDELDRSGGSYLWEFLEKQWEQLSSISDVVLERLIRRRAAMQLGRLNLIEDGPVEVECVHGLEYYVYPCLSGEFRLGEIIRNKSDHAIRVILTPHCHLTIQVGDECPRADHVLTIRALPAKETIAAAVAPKSPWSGSEQDKKEKLRRRTRLDADLGKPNGRYCFLPGFLEIPDLYCDLLQAESLPLQTIQEEYERLAVLDSPFAEALQSSFTRFYSAVGLPSLGQDGVQHLME